jgi:hypothetical protein
MNHTIIKTAAPGEIGIHVKRAYISGNLGVAVNVFGGHGNGNRARSPLFHFLKPIFCN